MGSSIQQVQKIGTDFDWKLGSALEDERSRLQTAYCDGRLDPRTNSDSSQKEKKNVTTYQP